MTVISTSAKHTHQIAATWAATLLAGQCVALHGELGAGKTQFVRGLLDGLGGDPRSVSSPTYMLLNVYPSGRLTLYHLDAYRVAGVDDFEGIGFPELLEQGGIVVVEWASRVKELLPADHIAIHIESIGVHDRRIIIGHG